MPRTLLLRLRTVVQEIARARRVEVLCGGHWIPLSSLKALSLLCPTQDSLYQSHGPGESHASTPREPSSSYAKMLNHQRSTTLTTLLEKYKNFECEDRRDRVYGLLGLVAR